MQRITVLVAGFSGMFAEIVTRFLTAQQDLDVIQGREPDEVLAAVRDRDVRVVLLPLVDGELPLLGGQLLAAKPSLRVVGITEHGREASLFDLRPVGQSLGDLSAQALSHQSRVPFTGDSGMLSRKAIGCRTEQISLRVVEISGGQAGGNAL